MSYDLSAKNFSKELDLKKLKPYGDTINDGKIQLSFTLPVPNDEKGEEAAKELVRKMGITDPLIAESISSNVAIPVEIISFLLKIPMCRK